MIDFANPFWGVIIAGIGFLIITVGIARILANMYFDNIGIGIILGGLIIVIISVVMYPQLHGAIQIEQRCVECCDSVKHYKIMY